MQHMPRLNRGKGAATRYLEEKGMGKGSPPSSYFTPKQNDGRRIFTIMKSYLLDTGRAVGPNGGSVFRRMESNYSAHRIGGGSCSIIDIAEFQ